MNFLEPVDKIPHDNFDEYLDTPGVEGIVAIYPGYHRVKHKSDEYVRLHRIVTDFTPKRVWEALASGDSLEFENMPEEFDKWLNETRANFNEKYDHIEGEVMYCLEKTKDMSDKELGLAPLDGKMKGLLFMLRKGKDIEPTIWKMIKPKND